MIISSDHGGKDKGHGGPTLEEMLSPLIMVGPGIEPGTVITDMVISPDIAVTMADRLGLKPSPIGADAQSWPTDCDISRKISNFAALNGREALCRQALFSLKSVKLYIAYPYP